MSNVDFRGYEVIIILFCNGNLILLLNINILILEYDCTIHINLNYNISSIKIAAGRQRIKVMSLCVSNEAPDKDACRSGSITPSFLMLAIDGGE
jgi:hypothetical protein